MAVETCLKTIRAMAEAEGLDLSDNLIDRFASDLESKKAGMTRAQYFAEASKIIENFKTQKAVRTRASRLMGINRREVNVRATMAHPDGIFTGIEAFENAGSFKAGQMSNYDVQDVSAAQYAQFANIFSHETVGVRDQLRRPEHKLDTLKELAALQRGESSVTKNKIAQQIAKAMHVTLEKVAEVKKMVNPFFEKIDEYLIKQSHNRDSIVAMGKDKWVELAMDTYKKKSFPGRTDSEKMAILSSIFDDIEKSHYGSARDNSAFVTSGRGGNILRRMAAERVLIPESTEIFYNYFEQTSKDSLEDILFKTISNASHDIAVLDKYGPTPEFTRDQYYDRLMELNPKQSAEIMKKKEAMDPDFKTMIGRNNSPATGGYKLIQQARSIVTLKALFGSFARSFPDLGAASLVVQDSGGRSVVGTAQKLIGHYVKAFSKNAESRNELMKDLYMFSRFHMAFMHPDIGASPNKDVLSKWMDFMGVVSLMNRHVDAARYAVGMYLSESYARSSDRVFADLEPTQQRVLGRYGIGEVEWDAIRSAPSDFTGKHGDVFGEGVEFKIIDASTIDALPDKTIKTMLLNKGVREDLISQRMINSSRQQLRWKFGAMINDHANFGSSTASTKELAQMYWGTDPNSRSGVALRLMWQFKSSALKTWNAYNRGVNSGKNPGSNWGNATQAGMIGGLSWVIGDMALQVLRDGKEPEDPFTLSYMAKMAGGAGGLGMPMDMAAEAFQQEGVGKMSAELAGQIVSPTLVSAAKAAAIGFQTIKAGKEAIKEAAGYDSDRQEFPARQAAQFVLGHVPGLPSHPATAAAYKYFFVNGVLDFFDGDYLRGVERQTSKKGGLFNEQQTYLFMAPTDSPEWVEEILR